jgi:transcriptional regulator with XRE-family HTH domain
MLHDARIASGLTQLEAANMLGVAQTFISKIEVLERKIELVVVLDLCHIYGIDFLKFMAAFHRAVRRSKMPQPRRLVRKDKGVRRG